MGSIGGGGSLNMGGNSWGGKGAGSGTVIGPDGKAINGGKGGYGGVGGGGIATQGFVSPPLHISILTRIGN